MIESPAGAVNPALTPLMNRVAINRVPSLTSAPSPEATTKTASEIRNMRRRPSRSAARPPSSRKPPYPSTYALTTHCSELVDMCRSVRIEGSATPIIDTSRASRKSAPHRTSSAPHARALRRSRLPSRNGEGEVVEVTSGLLGSLRSFRLLFDAHHTYLF